MQIEIWADIICPWCGLGAHRLELAVAEARERGADITVDRRSYQLDPAAPAATRPVREMLRRRGYGEPQMQATWARIEAMAAQEGLAPYHLDNVTGNTRLAHELLAFASARGLGDTAWPAMYRAYWGERKPIFTVDDLVPIGETIGLAADEVRDALTERRHRADVDADLHDASAFGITGVPFVLVDRRLAVSGAQPLDVFRRAIASPAAHIG